MCKVGSRAQHAQDCSCIQGSPGWKYKRIFSQAELQEFKNIFAFPHNLKRQLCTSQVLLSAQSNKFLLLLHQSMTSVMPFIYFIAAPQFWQVFLPCSWLQSFCACTAAGVHRGKQQSPRSCRLQLKVKKFFVEHKQPSHAEYSLVSDLYKAFPTAKNCISCLFIYLRLSLVLTHFPNHILVKTDCRAV